MNESLNEPVGGRTSISDALTSTLRQPSFLRVMLVLAATVVVLVGIRLAAPLMMGRGLNISPTIVFLYFIFWAWLLGGPGAFLALPITLFVAVMLDTFPETRWLANLIGVADMNTSAEDDAAPDASTRDAGAEHAS
jgi:AI-2 transport protein TqsA